VPKEQPDRRLLNKILRTSALLSFVVAASLAGPASGVRFDGCDVKPTSSLVVNVKDRGAKGDGKSDDTKSIQKAIDEVAGSGGTVYVPAGTYMVQAHGTKRLVLGSKMTLKLADRAILKVIPTGAKNYSVLRIPRAKDVTVIGGTLQGDRKEHKGRSGEWGMGIIIGPESERITIAGVTSRHMWGDGFYLAGGEDIALCSVVAEHNRRQGLSIIRGNRILVTNSTFRDTRGTRPSAGIDLEPNNENQTITNVRIEHSKFVNNAGDGILIAGKKRSGRQRRDPWQPLRWERPADSRRECAGRAIVGNLRQQNYCSPGKAAADPQRLRGTGSSRRPADRLPRGIRHAIRKKPLHTEEEG